MSRRGLGTAVIVLGLAGMALLLASTKARAVPSFGRQSGMGCNACHTVFPELTPFGRAFKLTGYVFSKKTEPYEFPPPVSAGGIVSFTNTGKAQPPGVAPFESRGNDNVNVPQVINAYYAGKLFSRVGTFFQGTYDGVSEKFLVDHVDIRYANYARIGRGSLIYGLTINNNPTVQDVWNSTPGFSFPYVSSSVVPEPIAAPKILDALALQVGGLGLYGFWNNLLYTEVALYRTSRNGPTQWLGAGTQIENLADGVIPYWRVALQRTWKQHSFSLGTYGLVARIFPEGQTRGLSDRFTDIGVDAQYQYIGSKHIFTAQATWIHEDQNRDGSFARGEAARRSGSLDTFKINGNYYYRSRFGTVGGTLAFFSTTGSRDPELYAPEPAEGSRTGRPDTNGFIIEANYLPWNYTKISVQYTIFTKFNGARTNYDGLGRKASDNNTLFLNVWLIF